MRSSSLDRFEARRRRRSRRVGGVRFFTSVPVGSRANPLGGGVSVPYVAVLDSEALGGAVIPESDGRRKTLAYKDSQGSALLTLDLTETVASLQANASLSGYLVDGTLVGAVAGISSNMSPQDGPLLVEQNGILTYAASAGAPSPAFLNVVQAPSSNSYVVPYGNTPIQNLALPMRSVENNHSYVDEFLYRTVVVLVVNNLGEEPLPDVYDAQMEYRVWLVQGGATG